MTARVVIALLVLRLETVASAACSSENPGDSNTEECQQWCTAADKQFDCTFCLCKSCKGTSSLQFTRQHFCVATDHSHAPSTLTLA